MTNSQKHFATPFNMASPSSTSDIGRLRGAACLHQYKGERAAISFTGGKDCHLALQRSHEAGLDVVCLVEFQPPSEKFQVHTKGAHRNEWKRIQADAMGIPLVTCLLAELEVQSKRGTALDYKAAYAAAIRDLQETQDIKVIITGDVDYVGSSKTNFKQQVCQEHEVNGVQVLLPLWQEPRKQLLREMIEVHGMDIRMTCVKAPHFDSSWIGRRIDTGTIATMESIKDGLDLNGENGEYHTMVVDGPMYKVALEFENVEAEEVTNENVQKDGKPRRIWVLSGQLVQCRG